ncbi:MAG: fasciclin domain-containing protein [Gammaproteobacteria bacterium]|jgi:uncharacterized surface protein with fasciclin (FAS1) repeats
MRYPVLPAVTFILAVAAMAMVQPAQAKTPRVSEILTNNGFQTLLFALDTTGLTAVLDENRVVLFAPTDDVFDATAEALGCADVLELATNLLNTPVGDTNALAYVLSYHAYLGRFRNDYDLLSAGELQMASGDNVSVGVGQNGLYVQGAVNDTPSTLTTESIRARKGSSVYAIDRILLPIDPTGICD